MTKPTAQTEDPRVLGTAPYMAPEQAEGKPPGNVRSARPVKTAMTIPLDDLRLALRGLRRSPLFAGVAILSLAPGIGANTAIFRLVDQLLLRRLPVAEASSAALLADAILRADARFRGQAAATENLRLRLRGASGERGLGHRTAVLGGRQTMDTERRVAILAAALALLALVSHKAAAQPGIPEVYTINGFAIGCQANTFNRFTVFEAIEKTARAGGRIIEFYPGQRLSRDEPDVSWSHDVSDDVIAKVNAKLALHSIRAVGYGVVPIPGDEPGARKVFEFAKKLGLRAVITESVESIDTLEKLAREYDIAVAYHHHPRRPNDASYRLWDPHYIAALVKDRDGRIGACADTGNWTRSGVNPVEALKILSGRLIAVHLKDMTGFGTRDAHEVPFGTGASEVKGCLDELTSQRFGGHIAVEYEYNWDDNVGDVRRCIDFVRNYRR